MKTYTEALIVVDALNDFGHKNWSLYVKNGELIIPTINRLIQEIRTKSGIIIGTKDWHPEDHISFASRFNLPPFTIKDGEMKWPNHSVANTWWAEYLDGIYKELIDREIRKGFERDVDSYSGFGGREFIDEVPGKTLEEILQEAKTKIVHIAGLATDYCVQATALDARKLWYETIVHADGIAAVSPKTEAAAFTSLRDAWVILHAS